MRILFLLSALFSSQVFAHGNHLGAGALMHGAEAELVLGGIVFFSLVALVLFAKAKKHKSK